ncbi:MAG: helix-turn-helix transcriptional regulator [Bradyrhizobium sp.]|nr:helix-turn-helix transcriptional regulator [Bradyrhizobium sp.]MBI5264475.1 helix-turn-helix transcriptional regulator [Bradyrhizobium sp.]
MSLPDLLHYSSQKATTGACCQCLPALCFRNEIPARSQSQDHPDIGPKQAKLQRRDMTESPDAESHFLEQLGQRVRTMRSLRGMSRKVLAKVSGISERYIAQLEGGKGNVSIVLLRRVSDAMGAHVEDLIPSTEPAPDWQMFRELLRKASPGQITRAKEALTGGAATAHHAPFCGIALIGLRGAGKSTLGRILAKKIGWSFVELNKEIEQQNGLSVAEIIALYGLEGFRRMEQVALQQLLARKEWMVLATGGGIVSEPLTFDQILGSFYTIWLKAEPEEHMARVRRQGDLRPMADDRSAMAELRNILVSREPLYARANAVVDTAGLSVDAAAARLIEAVRPVLQDDARSFGLHSVAL